MNDKPIPPATQEPSPSPEDVGQLYLGPVFAIAHDCDLDPSRPCVLVVHCQCGQPFATNLLEPGCDFPRCPACDLQYTTALVVALRDDDTIVNAFMEHVLGANGIRIATDDDDVDDDDDPDDDDEGDDEGEPGAAR